MANWRDIAACSVASADESEEAFGCGTRNEAPMRQFIASFCGGCQVKAQCLEEGMGEVYGVWGGLTPRQRISLRKRGIAA